MSTRHAFSRSSLLVLFAVAIPAPSGAQDSQCAAPDTAQPWFRAQRDWLADSRRDWTDTSFRSALLQAVGFDASRALPVQLGAQRERESSGALVDVAVLSRLRSLAATRGSTWPTRSVVGAAGVHAVFFLAQEDTALQRLALHRMMESGPDEPLPADVAVLEDRVRLQSGRKQLYGSQLRNVGGRLVPAPIEDSAHVDLRRDAAGLPPLRQAICSVR